MRTSLVPLHYLWWHYTLAWKELFAIYHNFLWFVGNFFSIPLLIRTLFKPWRRLGESYEGGFNPSAFFATLAVNTLMRLVGFLFRTGLIVVGVIVWSATLIAGGLVIIFWLLAPFIIVLLFGLGLITLFGWQI